MTFSVELPRATVIVVPVRRVAEDNVIFFPLAFWRMTLLDEFTVWPASTSTPDIAVVELLSVQSLVVLAELMDMAPSV
ncbi:MAG: hypothetical protein DWH83_05130 [Planctomycetota bacterium]|nr:MAG: hypothetical protein DWH83_05130 [Planctomycetota bacterium]